MPGQPMKYARFEWLTIGVGAVAVLGTVAFSVRQPDAIELVAQLMLLVVLVGAVHAGRKGGTLAALGATVLYIVMRTPTIIADGITSDVIQLILIRTCTYGLIGIIGGEICGRIKYFFARMEDTCSIDEHSRVYNERFIASVLANNLAAHRRYGSLFSIVVIELAPALTSDLRPSKASALVRAVADHVRNDVRLIDDVGRLDDGRFLLVLPHTPKEGAAVAGCRVRLGVRDLLGAKDESVTAQIYGVPDELGAIQELTDSLRGAAATRDGDETAAAR